LMQIRMFTTLFDQMLRICSHLAGLSFANGAYAHQLQIPWPAAEMQKLDVLLPPIAVYKLYV